MNKKLIVVLFCMFVASVNVYCQNDFTLAEALKCAIANNELINASEKSKEFSRHQLKAARGKHLPNIFLEGSANRINDPIVLKLDSARTAVIDASVATAAFSTGKSLDDPSIQYFKSELNKAPAFDMEFQKELFYKFNANLIWPLYTGGKISANSNVKKAELLVANMEYESTLNSVITSVIENYFRAKLAQEARDIRKDYLEDIKQHNSNAQKLFKVGMISKTNKLRAEVEFAQASREYQKAQRDFDLSLVVLSNIIGLNIENANLTTNFKKIEHLKDVENYEELAYSNNITLKTMLQQKDMVKQKKKAILAEFLPTIAAFGRYEIYKKNLTVFEPEWIAGLHAKMDIFNGGSDYQEYKAYSEKMEMIELYIENANKMVDTAVKKYHHEVVTALEQYESLKSSQDLTKENLKLYQKSFREGLATSIEVIDAELALEKVRLDQSQALFDYNVAYAHLMNICGDSQNLMKNILGDENKNEDENQK